MPAKKKPNERQCKVGDRIPREPPPRASKRPRSRRSSHFGSTLKLQVDFGKDMTALIGPSKKGRLLTWRLESTRAGPQT